MGERFANYMEHVYPRLMNSLSIKVEVKIVDVMDGDEDDEIDKSRYAK